MQYLTRKSSVEAIRNIHCLQQELDALYGKYGIKLGVDVGRKNILISSAQEHFFAKAIASVVGKCSNDGRTGAADIIIDSLNDREVECKVLCQGKKGSWQFQADKASLVRKGKLDFLYLLYDRTHDNVGLFLFTDLGPEDFADPAPGSRGKARLRKSTAFKKCVPIIGGFTDKRSMYIEKYSKEKISAETECQRKIAAQKLDLWYNKTSQFSIQLEPVHEII